MKRIILKFLSYFRNDLKMAPQLFITFLESWDNLVMVERIPTTLLSSCSTKLSRNPFNSSTTQKNETASAKACTL